MAFFMRHQSYVRAYQWQVSSSYMNKLIKISARPKLNSPSMLAAWPGISSVATIIAAYLGKKLEFKPLGWIEPSYFFEPIGVLARNGIIEEPQFPQSNFYYWKNKDGGSDLILFIGDSQPATQAYEFANCVLDVADRFQVRRVYTCAAAVTRIHHTEQPRAWGVATQPEILKDLDKHGLLQKGNLQISGLNGVLLGVAKERNIEGVCLLGEVPVYATRIQNPMAALSIMNVLSKLLGINIDLDELKVQAVETRERLKQVTAQAMSEYIDFFTEPIWEQGDETEEEE